MTKFFADFIKESNFDKWDELVEKYGTVFQSIRWTSLFEPNIRRIGIFSESGELIGGFIYYELKFGKVKIIKNPHYTPQVGPFFKFMGRKKFKRMETEKSIVKTMVDFIDSQKPSIVTLSLSPSITDTLPFYWAGYKVIVHYTYIIDLSQDESHILYGMSAKRRNDIKKASGDGLIVHKSDDLSDLTSLVKKTFEKKKKKFPEVIMKNILKKFPPSENSFFIKVEKEGVPLYGAYILHDAQTAFNLITGQDFEKSHRGAGALALWAAVKEAKKLGLKIFDFEGSMIPSIEKFFRGFGGDLVPYYRVNKAWLPLEIILKLKKRQLF